MQRAVKKILVVRLHSNMVKAASTQNVFMISYGFIDLAHLRAVDTIGDRLKIIPRNFQCEGTNSIISGIRTLLDISRLIKEENPEIVHVNALQDLLFVFVAVRLFASRKNRPAIVAMSRNPVTWQNSRRAWLAAQCIRVFADGFIALATTHKNQLIGLGVPVNRLTFIPNPYDETDRIINSINIPPSRQTKEFLRVVCVANISERKAQDVLVKAAEIVLKKHPNVHFDLVGRVNAINEEYANKLCTLIDKLSVGGQVHLVGEIPSQEVKACLANSDIFVFPSRSEMMPRAVVEAMLAGKPVIASATDGILDLIENGKTGILFQPGDEDALANALLLFIENPILAQDIAYAGHVYIMNSCSPERVGKMLHEFYQFTLNRLYSK